MEVKRPERVILPRPYTLEYRTGKTWHDADGLLVDEPDYYPDRIVLRFDGMALLREHKTVSMQTAHFRARGEVYEVLAEHPAQWRPLLQSGDVEGNDTRTQKEPCRMMLVVTAVVED